MWWTEEGWAAEDVTPSCSSTCECWSQGFCSERESRRSQGEAEAVAGGETKPVADGEAKGDLSGVQNVSDFCGRRKNLGKRVRGKSRKSILPVLLVLSSIIPVMADVIMEKEGSLDDRQGLSSSRRLKGRQSSGVMEYSVKTYYTELILNEEEKELEKCVSSTANEAFCDARNREEFHGKWESVFPQTNAWKELEAMFTRKLSVVRGKIKESIETRKKLNFVKSQDSEQPNRDRVSIVGDRVGRLLATSNSTNDTTTTSTVATTTSTVTTTTSTVTTSTNNGTSTDTTTIFASVTTTTTTSAYNSTAYDEDEDDELMILGSHIGSNSTQTTTQAPTGESDEYEPEDMWVPRVEDDGGDLSEPAHHRFEKLGMGECMDKDLQAIRGRGKAVFDHDECRTACYDLVGSECLGYSFYHCSNRCIVHVSNEAQGLGNWTFVRGDGNAIAKVDESCGAVCYRVTYGKCKPGQVLSNGVLVEFDEMTFGEKREFECPLPYEGSIVLHCYGLNSHYHTGMCLAPCPADEIHYKPGLPPISHPEMAIGSTKIVDCPISDTGNIVLKCQNDATVTMNASNCGSKCSGGVHQLQTGSGLISYTSVEHLEVHIHDCPSGYAGKVKLSCLDGVTIESDGTDYGCMAHCVGKGNVTFGADEIAKSSLPSHKISYDNFESLSVSAVYDVQKVAVSDYVTVPEKEDGQNSTIVETVKVVGEDGYETNEVEYYIAHGSVFNSPCQPDLWTYGSVQLECNNLNMAVKSHDCRFHCKPGEIEVGAQHTLYLEHPLIQDGTSMNRTCAPEDLWFGEIEMRCVEGNIWRHVNDTCYRHCEIGYVTSNGLNIAYNSTLLHGSMENVTCPGPVYAGTLLLSCEDGTFDYTSYCGKFCESEMVNSNGAMVLSARIEHTQTKNYTCPEPYVGMLHLECVDTKIVPLSSCGRVCPAGEHLVRNTVKLPYNQFDHGVFYEVGCPVYGVDTDDYSFTGSLTLTCDDSVVSEVSGFCHKNCLTGTVTSNGFDLSHPLFKHMENRTMNCENGREYGYLVLECVDGMMSILDGSCVASPCAADSMESAATRYQRLSYPMIDHLSEITLACPIPLTGQLTLECDANVVTPKDADCGNICKVNGTLPSDESNPNGFIVAPGLGVPLLEAGHLTSQVLECPHPSRGDVEVKCVDGISEISSGGCHMPCEAGPFYSPTGVFFDLPYLMHNDTMDNLTCPLHTTAGGKIRVICDNSTVVLMDGLCLKNCDPASIQSNGLTLRHSVVPHGKMTKVDCNSVDINYAGKIEVSCYAGETSLSGRCNKHCLPAVVESNGAFVQIEKTMYHKIEEEIRCRDYAPNFSNNITLDCNDGELHVLPGTQCLRDCEGFAVLFGSVFQHGDMFSGESKAMQCPSSGEITILCTDRVVSVIAGKCFKQCTPSSVRDQRDIEIYWNETIVHETVYPGTCNENVASGNGDVTCRDGEAMLMESFCKFNCPEGEIVQEGSEEQLGYEVILKHSDLVHNEMEIIYCPGDLQGRVEAKCEDGKVSVYGGNCGTNNCRNGTAKVGEDLKIDYPALNHAERFFAQCGDGFDGEISFECNEGITETSRIWTVVPVIDRIPSAVLDYLDDDAVSLVVEAKDNVVVLPRSLEVLMPLDARVTRNATNWTMIENVTLCECCIISGISNNTVGDGHVESKPPEQASGGAWVMIFLIVFLLCGFIYFIFKEQLQMYWYGTPKLAPKKSKYGTKVHVTIPDEDLFSEVEEAGTANFVKEDLPLDESFAKSLDGLEDDVERN